MNREQILKDEGLLKRFMRDYKAPINITVPEVFMERLRLMSVFNPKMLSSWEDYIDVLSHFNSTQDYFEVYNGTKDKMITFIKETEGYKRFNEQEDMSRFQVVKSIRDLQLPSKDIFKQSNIGEIFVSFDMCKANFSSLSCYDKGIFDDNEDWEDFVASFIPDELKYYLTNSKYMREVVLGNCNPKRHITYEKYLVSLILEDILIGCPEAIQKVVFFSNDEVIFKLDSMDLFHMVRPYFVHNKSGLPFKYEIFKLHSLGNGVGYCKEDLSDSEAFRIHPFTKFKMKSVNNFCMPFVYRKLLGQDITENDKLFIHPNEGLLSRFVEIPEVVISLELQESISEAQSIYKENGGKYEF